MARGYEAIGWVTVTLMWYLTKSSEDLLVRRNFIPPIPLGDNLLSPFPLSETLTSHSAAGKLACEFPFMHNYLT